MASLQRISVASDYRFAGLRSALTDGPSACFAFSKSGSHLVTSEALVVSSAFVRPDSVLLAASPGANRYVFLDEDAIRLVCGAAVSIQSLKRGPGPLKGGTAAFVGNLLATAADGSIQVSDPKTGRLLASFAQAFDASNVVELRTDGHVLVLNEVDPDGMSKASCLHATRDGLSMTWVRPGISLFGFGDGTAVGVGVDEDVVSVDMGTGQVSRLGALSAELDACSDSVASNVAVVGQLGVAVTAGGRAVLFSLDDLGPARWVPVGDWIHGAQSASRLQGVNNVFCVVDSHGNASSYRAVPR